MYFCTRLRSEATALDIVQSGWVGTHLQKRRLSTLCSLTARSLANSNLLSKTKQRVDVPLMCLYASSMFIILSMRITILHQGVGSACCSSDNRGNARRLEQWDE